MSESNVELYRRWFAAYNAGDIDAFIAACDRSIEFHSTFAVVGGMLYHGHDGVRRYFRDTDVWDEIRGEPEAYFDLGEHTLAFVRFQGRGRHSGADVAMPLTAVARWREGVIVYFKAYTHREDALSDLGVSEDERERIDP
jgi:ketosteroid isomerase-like protein